VTKGRIVAGFAIMQALAVGWFANGPSGDEGIYAWIGMRQMETFPSVMATQSMNGSPWLWPLFAGPVFAAGGLVAVRMTAVLLSVVALSFAVEASHIFFGEKAGIWSGICLVLCGPFLALAHLGVYDVPALTSASVALWCLARRDRGDGERWLLVAAVAVAVSVIAKYAYFFLTPVYGAIILSGGRRRARDLVVFGAVVTVTVIAHNLLVLGSLLPQSFAAYRSATVPLGRTLVALEQLYFAVPLAVALVGLRRPSSRRLGMALGSALLVWPLFHLAANSAQAAQKHIVAGVLLASPLLGVTLARMPRRAAVAATLAAWGVTQWATLEYSWPNAQPAVDYLLHHARAGDRMVSNSGTFRYLAALHRAGLDSAFGEVGPTPVTTDAAWIIWEDPGTDEQRAWLDRARRDGYSTALQFKTRFVGADEDLPFGVHTIDSFVLRRGAAHP
jgi:hypothetical protein